MAQHLVCFLSFLSLLFTTGGSVNLQAAGKPTLIHEFHPMRAPGWALIETYLYWLMQSTSRSLNMKNWVWKKEEKSIIWINMYGFRPHLRPLPRSLLDICMNNGLLTDSNYHRCFFIKGGRMTAISASLDSHWPIRAHAEVTMVTAVSVLNVAAAFLSSSFPLFWYTLLCV